MGASVVVATEPKAAQPPHSHIATKKRRQHARRFGTREYTMRPGCAPVDRKRRSHAPGAARIASLRRRTRRHTAHCILLQCPESVPTPRQPDLENQSEETDNDVASRGTLIWRALAFFSDQIRFRLEVEHIVFNICQEAKLGRSTAHLVQEPGCHHWTLAGCHDGTSNSLRLAMARSDSFPNECHAVATQGQCRRHSWRSPIDGTASGMALSREPRDEKGTLQLSFVGTRCVRWLVAQDIAGLKEDFERKGGGYETGTDDGHSEFGASEFGAMEFGASSETASPHMADGHEDELAAARAERRERKERGKREEAEDTVKRESRDGAMHNEVVNWSNYYASMHAQLPAYERTHTHAHARSVAWRNQA